MRGVRPAPPTRCALAHTTKIAASVRKIRRLRVATRERLAAIGEQSRRNAPLFRGKGARRFCRKRKPWRDHALLHDECAPIARIEIVEELIAPRSERADANGPLAF